jgi:tetratricopeptide (TPR) repeat protein
MSSSAAEALALLRAGRAAEAESMLREALARGSSDAQAIHMLGYLLASSGRASEGLPLLDRSIALDPRNPGFLVNRAQALLQMGLLDEALRDASAAGAIEPRLAEAWLALAHVLRRQGKGAESLAATERALAASPGHPGAAYHAALLRMDAGDRAAALRGFAQVLERDPRHGPALTNLGILLREEGREAEALECFAHAAAVEPGNAAAQNNLAMALQSAGRLDEALEAFVRAGLPESLANAAGLALELERLGEARDLYLRAAASRPGFANAEYGLGQVALREGRFAAGWQGYERRFETDPPQAQGRAPALPRLAAAQLGDARRVALWQEQGLGDQVLFTTLLPELERRSVSAVVEVDARLLGLYRRSLPAFEFTWAQDSPRAFAGCDFQLPLGSLPALFRGDADTFRGQPAALLRADPERVAAMRAQLVALAQGSPIIAVSWRSPQGGARRFIGERKSLALPALASIEALRGARLLDLQYGEVEPERLAFEAMEPGRLVRIPGLDTRNDLEAVAAALVACGRFVTVSNATAHLAGALGVPTQLLLPRGWPPFHYWAAERDGRSLWYPSVRIVAHAG